MVFTLDINTKGLKDLEKDFWPDVIEKFLDVAIKKSMVILEWEAIKEAPIDRGQLRSMFKSKFTHMKWVLYNPTKQALFVQFWTKPHAPPRKPIEKYALRKGINPWALWYSIKRKWTKANDFLGRAVNKSEKKIDRMLWTTARFLIAKLNK